MFDALFKKKPPVIEEATLRVVVTFDAEGVHYPSPADTAAEWLAMPFAFGAAGDLGARLAQIYVDGFGERRDTEFVLSWQDFYAVLKHPELGS